MRAQGVLRPDVLPGNKADQALFETFFVFAAIWAFGGALVEKDGINYRRNFDKWWRSTWTTVKLPSELWLGGRVGWLIDCSGTMDPRSAQPQTPHRTAPHHPPIPSSHPAHPAGKGSVYDYYVNAKTGKFAPWAELVGDVAYDSAVQPMGSVFVPTSETSSLRYFLDMMVRV